MSLLRSVRRERSLRRPTLLLVALLAVVLTAELALTTAFDGFEDGAGFPAWLPQLGSVGETVVFYLLALDLLKFVAIPATLVWFGYAYGRYSATDSNTDSDA